MIHHSVETAALAGVCLVHKFADPCAMELLELVAEILILDICNRLFLMDQWVVE